MKQIKYKHKTERGLLSIQAPSAEEAEPIIKKLVQNREEWAIIKVEETDFMKRVIGDG